jgi:hypothetical protein
LALEDESNRVGRLSAWADRWPAEVLPEILDAILRMKSPVAQAKAVAAYLPRAGARASALLAARFAAVDRLGGGTDPSKTRALAAFLPGLAASTVDREKIFRSALGHARRNGYATGRAIGLAVVIPNLGPGEQDAVRAELGRQSR